MEHVSGQAGAGRDPSASVGRDARRDFLGVPIDCLTMAETIATAEQAMLSRHLIRQVSINVAKFVAMRSNPELDQDVRSSDLVGVDGMGILWAARLLGVAVPERVAGVDLFERLLGLCATRGFRPYFLGARPEILRVAVSAAQQRHPGLVFAGWRDGYFSAAAEPDVVAAIRTSHADCLFIGMPTPHKERFLARHRDELRIPFIMGVGGALDVLAGKVRRAPGFIQALGLEWAFRTMQEPLRLLPRYLKTNAAFAAIMARAVLARRLSG